MMKYRGLFKPTYREVKSSDLRIVAHKSLALASQNFMISMASFGYDTCPMEGFDSKKIKEILNLPKKSEINMVISCGIRTQEVSMENVLEFLLSQFTTNYDHKYFYLFSRKID